MSVVPLVQLSLSPFLVLNFPVSLYGSVTQAMYVFRFDVYFESVALVFNVRTATAAPRFCRARSVSRRLLFAAVGVPRFEPRPEGRGAGVQNAVDEGSRWSQPAR
jgi:hypothetical protein